MNIITADLPVWHDHTPAYTSELGAAYGHTVTVRLKTTLPVREVRIKLLMHGEIEDHPVWEIPALDGEGRWFEYALHLHASKVHYAWQLVTPDDNLHFTMSGLHHVRRPYRDWFHYLTGYVAPEWAWKSVFYQIFPDRFRNGNPSNDVRTGEYAYAGRPVVHVPWDQPPTREDDIHAHYGGDLEGVTQAMPYLADLGVNGLWLTPIFVSPSAHKYDITDYRRVDPHFGGEEAFDAMLAAAREHDINIVLDGVFNHTGSENHLFRKAITDESAPEREMFTFRDAAGGKPPYVAFFDVPTLPKIDYASPMARNEFFDGESSVVRHWLRRGIAGWRLDVAQQIGIRGTDEGNAELHAALKRAARQENPQAYVFGERFFDPEAVLNGEGEDGVMNYHGFGLPVMEWFTGEHYKGYPSKLGTPELLDILWDAYHVLAPQIALNQFNLLDSHDVPRALTRFHENKTKLRAALALLVSYPGVPCIYYGTEIGLSQPEPGSMPFNRAPMPWNEREWDHALRSDVQRLIRLRRDSLALQRGSLRFVPAGEDAVAMLRSYTHADGQRECVMTVASRAGAEHRVTLDLPAGAWTNVMTGHAVGPGRVTVDASAGVMLRCVHTPTTATSEQQGPAVSR